LVICHSNKEVDTYESHVNQQLIIEYSHWSDESDHKVGKLLQMTICEPTLRMVEINHTLMFDSLKLSGMLSDAKSYLSY
jgi:hypothetical protein